jgi:hypothetical protein
MKVISLIVVLMNVFGLCGKGNIIVRDCTASTRLDKIVSQPSVKPFLINLVLGF